jgi:DNA-binding transcriptional LysR family regulator
MNLNQLRFASAVARLGSFSKAAEACHITQPTLSNAIMQFEELLGGRLFERTTRSVALTPFGQHLLPAINNVLASLTDLERSKDAYFRPNVKLARIGLSPVTDMARLARLIEPFSATHGDVEIIYKECMLDDLAERLLAGRAERMLAGQIDIAIWPKIDHRAQDLVSVELYKETLMYIPRGNDARALSAAGAIPVAALAGETFVLPHGTCGLAQITETLFAKHAVAINAYPGRALSYSMLEEWADLGIGAAVLPASKLSVSRAMHAQPIAVGSEGKHATMRMFSCWKPATDPLPHIAALQRSLSRRSA